MVSVIIPNYNHSRYLDRRIQSILNQTYSDIEVIILDDQSTDNSLEIISKYLGDERIRGPYVNKCNSGSPFLQWQKGIDMAKGEWIWIAESDDYADADFLEENLKHILENRCIASFCPLVLVDENGNTISQKRFKSGKVYSPFAFCLFNCIGPLIINTSSALFSSKIAKKISNEYTRYRTIGDFSFWIEFAKQGRICMCSETISYFTMHTDSTSGFAIKSGKILQERSRIADWGLVNGFINLFEYYLMVGQNLLSLTKYAHYESSEFQNEQIKLWNNKVRFPRLSIFLYRLCNRLFRTHYMY